MENQRELNLCIWTAIKNAFGAYVSEHENEKISHTDAEQALQYAISKLKDMPIKF